MTGDTDSGPRPGTRTETTYESSRKGVVRSCPNCSHTLVGDPDADCPNCGASADDQELVTDGGRDQDREPLQEIATGTCWYDEGDPGEEHQVRHEGAIEIYPNWVSLAGGPGRKWVPRERVEGVLEL